jgi:oxygen-independent coproporphyrinogen-3 oxidase
LSDPVSVYIHVPFCLKKCSYCDFYSTSTLSLLPAYVKSLQQEIKIRTGLPVLPGKKGKSDRLDIPDPVPKKARTIYFGGGTPSLLPLEDVERILKAVHKGYRVSRNAEITFEVNPGTVDERYLSGLKDLGINRLSIGVQSFETGKIKVLNRIHTIEQSMGAVESAKSAGFENIGLDLIYGTPGETWEKWCQDLKIAIGFKVAHLSCYMLTLEQGTPLKAQYEKGLFQLPGPDILADLFMATSRFLGQHGYEHYEISNFARGKKNRSRHNSSYWQMMPYDGFGPAAHSFGTLRENSQNNLGSNPSSPVRSWNMADLDAYIHSLSSGLLPVQEREVLSLEQQMLERVMLGLRTNDGLDIPAFEKIMGRDFLIEFDSLVADLQTQGLGAVVPGQSFLEQIGPGKAGPGKRFLLTLSGRARLDSIVEAFADKIL